MNQRDESWLRETLATAETPDHDVLGQLGAVHDLARRRRRLQVHGAALGAAALVGAIAILAVGLSGRETAAPIATDSPGVGHTSQDCSGPGTLGSGDDSLVVEPSKVKAGEGVSVRLVGNRRVSPDSLFVITAAPPCRTYVLRDAELVELGDGGLSQGISIFKSAVSFSLPLDIPLGDYTVCTVTETSASLADVCGSLSVQPR